MYWVHPEQSLLGCLASEDPDVWAHAVARITRLRQSVEEPREPLTKRNKKAHSTVRIFKLPTPIYSATNFWSMINWSSEQMLEPPYTKKFSLEDIKSFETSPLTMNVPSNSQFVERFIKLISENGTRAASPTLRDGLCHSTNLSRQRHPKRETKADFMV